MQDCILENIAKDVENPSAELQGQTANLHNGNKKLKETSFKHNHKSDILKPGAKKINDQLSMPMIYINT